MTPEQEIQLINQVEAIDQKLNQLTTDVETLTTDVETFNQRFSNYQQATQWVVQLAFSLIASATVIVVITNVFK